VFYVPTVVTASSSSHIFFKGVVAAEKTCMPKKTKKGGKGMFYCFLVLLVLATALNGYFTGRHKHS